MSVPGSDTAFMEEIEELKQQLTAANERAELAEYHLEQARDCLLAERNRINLQREQIEKLQARIDESQKQEPVAHMYPSDLEKFNSEETFAHSFFVADGNPNETSVPVFTQPIIKPDMEELEARFDTEFRRGKALEREIEELRKQLEENHRNAGVVRHDRGVRVD